MKALALWAIRMYQRLISPNKGYRCAYAAHTGHASCSALGYRAIRRFGVLGGMSVLDERLHKCGVAHRRYRTVRRPLLSAQAGFCDAGDCDCGDLDCDFDFPCDFGLGKKSERKSKKKRKRDQDVVLPPPRSGN